MFYFSKFKTFKVRFIPGKYHENISKFAEHIIKTSYKYAGMGDLQIKHKCFKVPRIKVVEKFQILKNNKKYQVLY